MKTSARVLLAVVLALWLVVAVVAGRAGAFESPPSRPPLALLVAVAAPPLTFFAGAVTTGVLTSGSSLGFLADAAARVSMGALPPSLIPTFAVPLWIISHLISLLQLSSTRSP